MKAQRISFMISVVFLLIASGISAAEDYDWAKDFNTRAEADPFGFRARLADRFKQEEKKINAVIADVPKPSDAYMLFRIGEIAGKPVDDVLEKYKSEKNKGWGALAKSLGIKPGSKEFHALKRGNDIYGVNNRVGDGDDKEKGPGKNKGKNSGKGKARN